MSCHSVHSHHSQVKSIVMIQHHGSSFDLADYFNINLQSFVIVDTRSIYTSIFFSKSIIHIFIRGDDVQYTVGSSTMLSENSLCLSVCSLSLWLSYKYMSALISHIQSTSVGVEPTLGVIVTSICRTDVCISQFS